MATAMVEAGQLTGRELMAHLFRRAGFGATQAELDAALAKGYEATVEELLHPERLPELDEDLIFRYYVDFHESRKIDSAMSHWVYRMINTHRPLEEKMTLFWHCLFATGNSKVEAPPTMLQQITTFRRFALGNFRDILVDLSRDPAMIFWLDNNENTKTVYNENYGRELLELFSMGIGNYSEDDVKECARAFTGWTFKNPIPTAKPYGRFKWEFEFRPELHDEGEKTFLGETGNFNGEEIVDIVVRQPATAQFLAQAPLPLLRGRPAGPGGDRRAGRGLRPLRLRDPGDAARAVPLRRRSARGGPTTRWSRARPTTWSGCCGWPRTSASRSPASTTWRSSAATWGRTC